MSINSDQESRAIGTPQEPIWPTRHIGENTRGIIVKNGTYGFAHDSSLFSGWIEDEGESWIIFLDRDGKPALYYAERDENGRVVGEGVKL